MKISTVLETITSQLRSETDELLNGKSDLLEILNEAKNYSLDNFEVPYQKMADKVREALLVVKNLIYIRTIHLNEYRTTYHSLIKTVFIPELVELERNILRIKEDNITVDPNLSIDTEKMGFKMIKEIKAPHTGNDLVNRYIEVEIDDSTSYSVPELVSHFGSRLHDLCYYFYQLFDGQIDIILEKHRSYMRYLEETINDIDRILEENSDPREAQTKLKDIYTRLSDRHSEDRDNHNFLIPYYSNLLMVSDNMRKTYDIYQRAHDIYVDPANVKYGIL